MQFSDQERAIYEYHNGEKTVFADPLAVQRKMLRLAAGNLAGLSQDASTPEPDALGNVEPQDPSKVLLRLDAQEALVGVIREAFGLAPFDPDTGKGVPEKHCWKVWDDFYEWLEKNVKRGEEQPAGPPPSVSSPDPSTT